MAAIQELVADINPSQESSDVRSFTQAAGTTFFISHLASSSYGFDLWKTDGTAAGTMRLRTIEQGGNYGEPELVAFGNQLIFSTNIKGGAELWSSDGTVAGTQRLKQISGDSDSTSEELTNVNGTLFFRASGGAGSELWKSDGTSEGTVLVKDIRSGNAGSFPLGLQDIQGTLYFSADDGIHGRELWKSDGTAAGTILLKDIHPSNTSSDPSELTAVGNTVFFRANEPTSGTELWKTDGTTAGTVLVKNIALTSYRTGPTPAANSYLQDLTNVSGTLFFSANDGVTGQELWKSDGTEQGTVLVKDLRPGDFHECRYCYEYGPAGGDPKMLTSIDDKFVFAASSDLDGALWVSDGTPGGTQLLKDNLSIYSDIVSIASEGAKDRVYFSASDPEHGIELWTSDGTAQGTKIVKDIAPGPLGSRPEDLTVIDNTLFFQADDSIHGGDLWTSDGTAPGTTLVRDLRRSTGSSYPQAIVDVQGAAYFQAFTRRLGREFWKSRGTNASTVLIKDIAPGYSEGSLQFPESGYPDDFTPAGNVTYFSAEGERSGRELWKTDGTLAGTVLVKDIIPGGAQVDYNAYIFYGGDPSNLHNFAGTLYFSADDAASYSELWKSDGTAAGTVKVKDIRPGRLGSYPRELTNFKGSMLFFADDGVHGSELWRSDGTAAGTVLLKDIRPGKQDSEAEGLTLVGNVLFFTADDGVGGQELWKTDGTTAGTIRVKDIALGAAFSYPSKLTNVGGTLFFEARDSQGYRLWKSDGTSAGTVPVRDINPAGYGNPLGDLVAVNNVLYFTANDNVHGLALWKSNSTTAGTVMVKQVPARELTNVGGTLYFSGLTAENKWILWTSDGTARGTQPVATELAQLLVDVDLLTVVGGQLYYRATLPDVGTELFVVRHPIQALAFADAIATPEDTAIRRLNVLANDRGDGPLRLSSFQRSSAQGGTVIHNGDGTFFYQPPRNFYGVDSFNYTLVDADGQKSTANVRVRVTSANDAPVLDRFRNAPLVPIKEDQRNSYGTPIWHLLAGATDADSGASRGVAIASATSANGVWQFTLNGGTTWQSLGAVSASAARLLPANGNQSRIRFVPHRDFSGTVSIGYVAWDQTQGTIGGRFNVSQAFRRGGTTAFSTNVRASTLAVIPVNDRPVVTAGSNIGYHLNASPITLAGNATVSDVDSANFAGGYLIFSIGNGADAGNRLLIRGAFQLQNKNGVLQVRYGNTHLGDLVNDGVGTRHLRVNFTAQATPGLVQQLLRSVQFRTLGAKNTATRVINVVLNDSDSNGTRQDVFATVNVTL